MSAVYGDSYFPVLWEFYRSHRGTLFRLIRSLSFVLTTRDQSLIAALEFLLENENRRGDYPEPAVDLSFAGEKRHKIVLTNIYGKPFYDRKHFEVCVFSQLIFKLKSDDNANEGSEEYADVRLINSSSKISSYHAIP